MSEEHALPATLEVFEYFTVFDNELGRAVDISVLAFPDPWKRDVVVEAARVVLVEDDARIAMAKRLAVAYNWHARLVEALEQAVAALGTVVNNTGEDSIRDFARNSFDAAKKTIDQVKEGYHG